jgi:hypothetical protein
LRDEQKQHTQNESHASRASPVSMLQAASIDAD